MNKKDKARPRTLQKYKEIGRRNHIFLLRKLNTEKEFVLDFINLTKELVKEKLKEESRDYINILGKIHARNEDGYVDLNNEYFDMAIEIISKRYGIDENSFYGAITEFCKNHWLGQEWIKSIAILLTTNQFHPPVKGIDIKPTEKNLKSAKMLLRHNLEKSIYADADNYSQLKSSWEIAQYNKYKTVREREKAIFEYRKNSAENNRKPRSDAKRPKFRNNLSDRELLKRTLKLTSEQAEKEADSIRHAKNRQKLKI